jgi:hypothetical protein
LAIGNAGCVSSVGDAGPFEGEWTGTANVTTMKMDTVSQGMTMVPINDTVTQTNQGILHIEGSRVMSTDMIAWFENAPTCVFSFVRTGTSAMLVSGSTCTLDASEMHSMLGMNDMNTNVMGTVTVSNGTLSVSGSQVTLNLTEHVMATGTIMRHDTTGAVQSLDVTVSEDVTVAFTGTLR